MVNIATLGMFNPSIGIGGGGSALKREETTPRPLIQVTNIHTLDVIESSISVMLKDSGD